MPPYSLVITTKFDTIDFYSQDSLISLLLKDRTTYRGVLLTNIVIRLPIKRGLKAAKFHLNKVEAQTTPQDAQHEPMGGKMGPHVVFLESLAKN